MHTFSKILKSLLCTLIYTHSHAHLQIPNVPQKMLKISYCQVRVFVFVKHKAGNGIYVVSETYHLFHKQHFQC